MQGNSVALMNECNYQTGYAKGENYYGGEDYYIVVFPLGNDYYTAIFPGGGIYYGEYYYITTDRRSDRRLTK